MAPFLTKLALKFGVDWNSDQLPTWFVSVVVAAICTYMAGFVLSWLLPAEILPLKLIRSFLSRRKKVEIEDQSVPSTTDHVILKCDLSAWQKAWYKIVTEDGRVVLGRHGHSRLQNLMVQLRKVCNHPYLFLGQHYPEWNENIVRSSGKFELLDRVLPKLDRAGHRVLVFSQMPKCMTILEDYLSLKGYQFLRLDDSIRGAERDEMIQQFNAPDSPYFIFILSTQHRPNFHTADTIIMFDSDCLPQMDHQVQDVRVFVLVSVGSLEEAILQRAKQAGAELGLLN